jgi:hypothetical protein
MRSDLIDLDVQLVHQTEKAILVTLDVPDNAVWLPRSRCELSETGIGGIMRLTLPEPLALEKGLI